EAPALTRAVPGAEHEGGGRKLVHGTSIGRLAGQKPLSGLRVAEAHAVELGVANDRVEYPVRGVERRDAADVPDVGPREVHADRRKRDPVFACIAERFLEAVRLTLAAVDRDAQDVLAPDPSVVEEMTRRLASARAGIGGGKELRPAP